ncbi:MAG: hypothetical protein IPP12_18155 [Nitrospira sp.]|nr:hypothetical protein [Nitrospira sp.]
MNQNVLRLLKGGHHEGQLVAQSLPCPGRWSGSSLSGNRLLQNDRFGLIDLLKILLDSRALLTGS